MKFGILRVLCAVWATLMISVPAFAQGTAPVCEPGKLAQKYPSLVGKTIRIGADPQTPPYVMRDSNDFSKVHGIGADLATAVLDCAGIKHDFFLGAWSGMLPALSAGQIDLFWDDLYYTPERAKQVNFVVYMTAGSGALISASNSKIFTSFDSLCGHSAAVGVGTVEAALVRTQSDKCVAEKKPGISTVTFSDVAAGTRLVQSKRVDAMMYDLGLVDSLVKTSPQIYARGFPVMSGLTMGVAVSKHDQDLQNALYDSLRAIQANGKQKALFQKYGLDPSLQVAAQVKTQ
jgi:polar amino acid transport system substrate-binding protein